MTEEHAPQMRFDREQIEKRIDVASELFASGFNCAQSVVAAFADLYGVDRDLALRMAAPFGGGLAACARHVALPADYSCSPDWKTDRPIQPTEPAKEKTTN